MAVKFFGQFLIEKGIITHAALLKAISLQEETNRKIGAVVFEMEMMTHVEVAKIHQSQRNEDTRFGDKAVAMGFLTDDQLQQALIRQRNSHLYIGESLVKTGGLSIDDLEEYLVKFKEDQQPYTVEKIEIPLGVTNHPIWEIVANLTNKMLSRVAEISFRAGPCEVIEKLPSRTMVAEIGFSGSVSARYLLTTSQNSRKMIARAILQENDIDSEPTEVLDDSVMKFINIACGNIAAKAAQIGFQIDISPPKTLEQPKDGMPVPEKHTGLMFPMYLSNGEVFELAIFINNDPL